MFRRLLLGTFVSCFAAQAGAAVCTTVGTCTSIAPCDWNNPATWDCRRVPAASTADTCVIGKDTSVVLSSDGLTCGSTTVNGTWIFDESPAGRNAQGYRTFTVTGDVLGNSGGLLRMRAGHRLAFNTVNGPRVLQVNDGFDLDVQGLVHETTIAALSDAPINPTECGQGAPGREYTIRPADGAAFAHPGGRVVFLSGKARNRHLEIRATTATDLRVCTDLLDAASGNDSTGGQRLTPHANRSAFCTSRGVPSACCTAKEKGSCPGVPVSRHSEPAPYGASACTGDKAPYECCTGVGQGRCTAAVPAVGDRIAIIHDAWIYRAAGNHGYRITGDLLAGNDPLPIFRAVNIANAGTPEFATTSSVEFLAKPGARITDLEYLNFHDYAPKIDGIRFMDVPQFNVRWSAIHDVMPLTQGDTNATLATGYVAVPPNDVSYTDNIFYRTQGVAAHLNEGGPVPATGNKFLRNIIFSTCLAGANECGGLQGDNLPGGEAAENLIYDLYAGDNPATGAFTISLTGRGAAIHHNWIVNSAAGPGPGGSDSAQMHETAVTHNYISHLSSDGGNGGRWYSNVIRNYGLGAVGVESGIVNPIKASGNYILGVEAGIQSSPDCAGVCGSRLPQAPCACGRIGIRYVRSESNDDATATEAVDNIVASLASYDGFGGDGRCVDWDGWMFSAAGFDANWDSIVDHLTCDGRHPSIPVRGLSFDQEIVAMVPPIAIQARDLVMLSKAEGPAMQCSALAGVNESFGLTLSLQTADPSAGGGDYAQLPDCADAPPILRVPSLPYLAPDDGNYNLVAGAPTLTAGTQPPSSPAGVRAFRFDRDSLQSPWSTAPESANAFCTGSGIPSSCCIGPGAGLCSASVVSFDGEMPADVANVDNGDLDGDGVLDLHDNCASTANPDQLDMDRDGAGVSCDCNDANAEVHPGAVERCNGFDDDCNGLTDDGPGGLDPDQDGVPGACDDCPATRNRDQADLDADGEGDACDLDDGLIVVTMPDQASVSWQLESGFDSFNVYRGDLAVLLATGVYTQDPALVPLAARSCGLLQAALPDVTALAPGQAVFYLVTGTHNAVESSLGTDSAGAERLNANPCP